mgnify:CR=1 FL=1
MTKEWTFLDYALWYAKHGFAVHQIKRIEKFGVGYSLFQGNRQVFFRHKAARARASRHAQTNAHREEQGDAEEG